MFMPIPILINILGLKMGINVNTLTIVIFVIAFVGLAEFLCLDGWLQHGKSCYFFNTSHSDWDSSMGYCRHHGGYLAEIENSDENDFLTKECLRRGTKYSYWVGGKDETKGIWLWMSSGHHINYTKWNHGEPNNRKYTVNNIMYTEDCLELRGRNHFHWNDMICISNLSFICEKSATSAGPSSPFG